MAYLDYQYVAPEFFWGLLIIPLLIGYRLWQDRKDHRSFSLPTVHTVRHIGSRWPEVLSGLLFGLEMLAIGLLVTAMARPQDPNAQQTYKESTVEGIDIMIAMDVSESMLAEDSQLTTRNGNPINRITAAKAAAMHFVSKRPNDNIGLVIYEGGAFLKCPMTTDHEFLNSFIEELEAGGIKPGTAVGTGLGTAAGHLLNSNAKSKVVILLSDGVSNTGQPPLTVAKSTSEFGIRVYTIGIGAEGKALVPFKNIFGMIEKRPMEVNLDEATLRSIAEMTGGKYFRAYTPEDLIEIYDLIDSMEKSRIEATEYHVDPPEEYDGLLMLGLSLVLLSFTTKNLLLKGLNTIN